MLMITNESRLTDPTERSFIPSIMTFCEPYPALHVYVSIPSLLPPADFSPLLLLNPNPLPKLPLLTSSSLLFSSVSVHAQHNTNPTQQPARPDPVRYKRLTPLSPDPHTYAP